MSRLVAKLCYRNGKRTSCHKRKEKWSCFKHVIFKQSTQGKGGLLSGVSLPVSLLEWCLLSPWKESRARWGLDHPGGTAGAWTPHWHSFPGEGTVAASHAGLMLEVEGERGCCATGGGMGNPEQHHERDLRWSSWWSKRERKAACSYTGAQGRQSGTAVWLSPACRTSHVSLRLLGSQWFLSKVRVALTQKK